MLTYVIAASIVLVMTTVLTIAGLGSAFVVIPTLYWLGVPLPESMAIGLLLNAIGMAVASVRFARLKLIAYRTALPVIALAVLFSPIGAWSSRFLRRDLLLGFFVAFLIFAATMMLAYKPRGGERRFTPAAETGTGMVLGVGAGYLGGLLGVGGGNFVVPVLIWLGFEPKKASATTAFIVVFASLAGFFGHAALGGLPWPLLAWCAAASIAGAIVGASLMARMPSVRVRQLIAVVLLAVAAKMAAELIG